MEQPGPRVPSSLGVGRNIDRVLVAMTVGEHTIIHAMSADQAMRMAEALVQAIEDARAALPSLDGMDLRL